jgi:uncharacterized protein
MPPINVLIKPASGLCNMECDYCFYCDEANKRLQKSYGFMSEETLKNVIRKTILRAEGHISYAFQGGEPTLRGIEFFKKVLYYQSKYNKNNIKVTNALQTNGYAINEEWCKFFHDHQFLIGVSIDGVQETHNAYRHDKTGAGTYEKIVHATKLMDQYEVEYNILTVVNKKTAENIEQIYQDYKARNWNYQQYIACLEPLEEERGKKEYALTPKEYGSFLIKLFHLWYSDLQAGKQPYIRQFENYLAILLGYRAECCDQNGVCGIQNVVEADGSVYPCDFYMLDEYRLGNFNYNQLDEIYEKSREIQFIERSLLLSKECKECKYFPICKGGCQRNRDLNADTNLYENYLCEGYYLFFEACYDSMVQASSNIRLNKK